MVIQTTYSENLFFVFFKKHFCPHCGEKLERSYIWEVLPEKSMAAQRYRAVGDTTYSGDVQLRTGCFYCGKCKEKISYQEVRATEAERKRNKRG